MKSIYLIIALAWLAACSKSGDNKNAFPDEGIWVETTLQHDTIDLDIDLPPGGSSEKVLNFRSRPFTDPAVNPGTLINLSSYYWYVAEGNSVRMNSLLSSSGVAFYSYVVTREDATHFTIDRFYLRNALPQTIRFTRIR